LDFWTENILMFKKRVVAYKNVLNSRNNNGPLNKFEQEHEQFDKMIKCYFQLFEHPNKFHTVMEDLQT